MPNSDHPAPNATFSLPPPTLHSVMIRWIETSRGQYAETPSQVSNGWSFPDDSRNRASALAETKSARNTASLILGILHAGTAIESGRIYQKSVRKMRCPEGRLVMSLIKAPVSISRRQSHGSVPNGCRSKTSLRPAGCSTSLYFEMPLRMKRWCEA